MTTVWIDPVELQQTAALLQTLVQQLEELAGGLPAVCRCEMPPAVASYVNAEVSAAQAGATMASGAYGSAATDARTRADLITADQSLVGASSSAFGSSVDVGTAVIPTVGGNPGWNPASSDAWSSLYPSTMTLGGNAWGVAGGGIGVMTLGGASTGPGITVSDPDALRSLYPSSMMITGPDPDSPLMRTLNNLAGSGASFSTQSTLLGIMTGSALIAGRLAPTGVGASLGAGGSIIYEDGRGGRSTDLGSFYVDPTTGKYYHRG